MSAVAAEKPWVCCPKGAPMPNHHQLHLTLVNVDKHSRASLCVHEEDDGKDGHLKLRTGPNKSTANRLYQTMPAKLEVEDVVILIRLWIKNKTVRQVCKCILHIYIHCIFCQFLKAIQNQMYPNSLTYKVMVPGLITFVVQIVALFLQVKLNPVVETNDFHSRSCLSNKDMFKSTGVQAGKCINSDIIHTYESMWLMCI